MRKSYVKKYFVIGIICLLMLLSFQIVNALHEYPREEGPYKVFMGGKCSSGGNKPLWFDFPGLLNDGKPRWFQLGPFSLHRWPVGPQYKMENGSILIVNGKIQNIEYPVSMMLKGFKGYAPSIYNCFIKTLISSRIRVFGVCEEIDLYN